MPISRKRFLTTSFAAMAASLVPPVVRGAAYRKKGVPGLQLYSVRPDMNKDAPGTLQQLADMGWRKVEHAGYWKRKFYGHSAAEFKSMLAGMGISMVSGHVFIGPDHWDEGRAEFTDEWKYTVEDAVDAGQLYLVTPSIADSWRKDYDTLLRHLEVFNRCGEYCRKSGLTFGYHNHSMEFETFFNGTTLYDIILQHTDPALVTQQLDIGNMYGAGGSPLDFIRKYPGRFRLLHVRDEVQVAAGAGERGAGYDSTVLGKGVMPVGEIVNAALRKGGTTEFIVEQESFQGKPAIEAVREDRAFMKQLGFLLVIVLAWAAAGCQAKAQVNNPRILMDDYFGVNVSGCTADPHDIKKVAGWVRDYSKWRWLEPEKDQYHFTNALGYMNYDAWYRALDSQGIKSLFVVQQTPAWVMGKDSSFAPSSGQDGLHPDQYTDAASFFYQLAARYGHRKTEAARLRTPDKLSGLRLMDAIEVYNEPDGHWGAHMSLQQYAALLNAAYDGNSDSMKGQYGIKAADPDMLVSIGGLTGNLQSLEKIVAYAGRAPFDIINAHYYTFRKVRENLRVSVAPEWSSLVPDMKEMVAWSRQHAPGKPIWLTEIGWDTKPYNPESVTQQEAANYLIRSYLLALGTGVQKCFWFMYSDIDDSQPPGIFTTSGLFENGSTPYAGPTRLKPKLTYWYGASMRQWLSGYYFDADSSYPKGDSTIYDFRFSEANDKKRIAVVWYCPRYQFVFRPLDPSPSNRAYFFTLPDSSWKITKVIRPAAGTLEGQPQSFTKTAGGISLRLDATPVFIEMDRDR